MLKMDMEKFKFSKRVTERMGEMSGPNYTTFTQYCAGPEVIIFLLDDDVKEEMLKDFSDKMHTMMSSKLAGQLLSMVTMYRKIKSSVSVFSEKMIATICHMVSVYFYGLTENDMLLGENEQAFFLGRIDPMISREYVEIIKKANAFRESIIRCKVEEKVDDFVACCSDEPLVEAMLNVGETELSRVIVNKDNCQTIIENRKFSSQDYVPYIVEVIMIICRNDKYILVKMRQLCKKTYNMSADLIRIQEDNDICWHNDKGNCPICVRKLGLTRCYAYASRMDELNVILLSNIKPRIYNALNHRGYGDYLKQYLTRVLLKGLGRFFVVQQYKEGLFHSCKCNYFRLQARSKSKAYSELPLIRNLLTNVYLDYEDLEDFMTDCNIFHENYTYTHEGVFYNLLRSISDKEFVIGRDRVQNYPKSLVRSNFDIVGYYCPCTNKRVRYSKKFNSCDVFMDTKTFFTRHLDRLPTLKELETNWKVDEEKFYFVDHDDEARLAYRESGYVFLIS
jgi:hypothetical protein